MREILYPGECSRIRLDKNDNPIHSAKGGWPLCRDCHYWRKAIEPNNNICVCTDGPYYGHLSLIHI